MKVELIRVTENPVEAIELAASNCYDSEITGGAIMNHCYKSGHHSVLEFADFHFHIEGVSRALTHQLVRSRLASFAQRSQRYVNEGYFKYVTPDSIIKNKTAYEIYDKLMYEIKEAYTQLIEHNIPAEDARFVLPNACESIIDVKMNLRELIHFMNERLCNKAQWEIRDMANLMKKCVEDKYPEVSKYLVPKCEKNAPYCFCTEDIKRCCGRHKHISEVITL